MDLEFHPSWLERGIVVCGNARTETMVVRLVKIKQLLRLAGAITRVQ